MRSYTHKLIINNGGLSSVKWAPILTFDIIVQEWYNVKFSFSLSKGGSKILLGYE